MAPTELVCRVRVKQTNAHDAPLVRMEEMRGVTPELRQAWFKNILGQAKPKSQRSDIRPLDLVLQPDGTVKNIAKYRASKGSQSYVYPAEHWMPPHLVEGKSDPVFMKEKFATFALAYNMLLPTKPFEEITDAELHWLLEREESSSDLDHLEDEERAQVNQGNEQTQADIAGQDVITPSTNPLEQMGDQGQRWNPMEWGPRVVHGVGNHVRNNPGEFALQVAGGMLATGALATPLALGAVGFGAAGPIAGTVAAGWQASIGAAVTAGSPFAICQSIAMGGAVAGTVATTGVGGTVAAAAGSVPALFRTFTRRG